MPRSKKFGKRKFSGNQFCRTDVNITIDKIKSSASGKKIDLDQHEISENTFSKVNSSYIIVELGLLSNLLNNIAKCGNCDSSCSFEVSEDVSSRRGLAVSLVFSCSKCGTSTSTMTSRAAQKVYDVNVRLMYGMRCIGKGKNAATTLCAMMNLPPPPAKFERYNELLLNNLSAVCNNSMLNAVKDTVNSQNNNNIVAAFDGTWQKRGYTSLNGVVCATSLENGKVMDFDCLTKYCFICKNRTGQEHQCQKNFEGFSGGMEAEGVLNIFRRSEVTRNVRYIKYLGDGDSKGFSKVSDAKIYGDDVKLEKLECIGHVQKRMGARLRSLRNQIKKDKLSDGKTISGRGRLTDTEILKLQNYYGLAIRRNTSKTVDDMVKAIWAIYFHRLSTDKNPQHGLCPTGTDSWCGFHKAQIIGENYIHKHSLPEAVLTAIKPVFRSLTDKNLLEKCMHGCTQNPNESFNNCVWERLPKTNFVGIKTMQIGVMDAVICFNDGVYSRIKVLEAMGITPGINMCTSLRKIDRTRVCEAELKVQNMSKEARTRRKMEKKRAEDVELLNQNEYGPGMF